MALDPKQLQELIRKLNEAIAAAQRLRAEAEAKLRAEYVRDQPDRTPQPRDRRKTPRRK